MSLPWIKAIGLLRDLLSVVGPPVLRVLRDRLHSPVDSQVSPTPSDELLVALRQDLQHVTTQLERLHLHAVRLESRIRLLSWLSLGAVGLALIAVGIAAFASL
jgi:hypothetical protein